MRLADKILAYGLGKPDGFDGTDQAWRSEVTGIKELLTEAQVFIADDVSDYFFSYSIFDQAWDIAKDIPNLTPPFDVMFVEYEAGLGRIEAHLSEKYVDDLRRIHEMFEQEKESLDKEWIAEKEADLRKAISEMRKPRSGFRAGVLFTSTEIKESDDLETIAEVWELSGDELKQLLRYGGWSVTAEAFSYNGNAKIANGPFAEINYLIDKQGQTLRCSDVLRSYSGDLFMNEENEKCADYLRKTCFIPALLAICFIHCRKEVKVIKQEPLVKNSLIRKKHKLPPLTYYTLEIEPIKRILEQSKGKGDGSQSDLKKRLHICRGHFVHYTPDAPLFGKHTGTYWRQQHVRGKIDEGIVVKDYEVKAPPA